MKRKRVPSPPPSTGSGVALSTSHPDSGRVTDSSSSESFSASPPSKRKKSSIYSWSLYPYHQYLPSRLVPLHSESRDSILRSVTESFEAFLLCERDPNVSPLTLSAAWRRLVWCLSLGSECELMRGILQEEMALCSDGGVLCRIGRWSIRQIINKRLKPTEFNILEFVQDSEIFASLTRILRLIGLTEPNKGKGPGCGSILFNAHTSAIGSTTDLSMSVTLTETEGRELWYSLSFLLDRIYFAKFRVGRHIPSPMHYVHLTELIRRIRPWWNDVDSVTKILASFLPQLCPHDDSLYRVGGFLSLMLPVWSHDVVEVWFSTVTRFIWPLVQTLPTWDLFFFRLVADVAHYVDGDSDVFFNYEFLEFVFGRILQAFCLPIVEELKVGESGLFGASDGGGSKGVGSESEQVIEMEAYEDVGFDERCYVFSPAIRYVPPRTLVVVYAAKFVVWLLRDVVEDVEEEDDDDDDDQMDVDGNGDNGDDEARMQRARDRSTDPRMRFFFRLIRSIESFFHPSLHESGGPWMDQLSDFLAAFCERLVSRQAKSKARSGDGVGIRPALSDETVALVVKALLPLLLKSMLGTKDSYVAAANHSLKHLCSILPEVVFPPLLEQCVVSLQTFLAPHHTANALANLCQTVVPLLKTYRYDSSASSMEALVYVVNLCLPAIDLNDKIKTTRALRFFSSLFLSAPILTKSLFEGWCEAFLDRIFILLSSQLSSFDASSVSSALLWNVLDFFASQLLNDDLFGRMCDKTVTFVLGTLCLHAKKDAGHLISSFAFARPSIALPKFVSALTNRLLSTRRGQASESLSHLTDAEIEVYLHLLALSLFRVGKHVLDYREVILSVLDSAISHSGSKKKVVWKEIGKLFRACLSSLTFTFITDVRPINPSVWKSPTLDPSPRDDLYEFAFPRRDQVEVVWHEPEEDEVAFAADLLNRYMVPVLEQLDATIDILTDSTKTSGVDLQIVYNNVNFIRYASRGVVQSLESPYRSLIVAGVRRFTSDETSVSFSRLVDVLCRLSDSLLSLDAPKVLKLIAKTLFCLFCVRQNTTYDGIERAKKSQQIVKQSICTKATKRFRPRPLVLARVRTLYLFRLLAVSRSTLGVNPVDAQCFDSLLNLSLSSYSNVRRMAQDSLSSCLERVIEATSGYLQQFISRLIQKLSGDSSLTEHELIGVAHVLQKDVILSEVLHDMTLFTELVETLCLKFPRSHSNGVPEKVKLAATNLWEKVFSSYYHMAITTNAAAERFRSMILKLTREGLRDLNLHWKYRNWILLLFHVTVRSGHSDRFGFPLETIQAVFDHTGHSVNSVRSLAMDVLNFLLCEIKFVQPKKTFRVDRSFEGLWRNAGVLQSSEGVVFLEKNWQGWLGMENEKALRGDDQMEEEGEGENLRFSILSYDYSPRTSDEPPAKTEMRQTLATWLMTYFSNPAFLGAFLACRQSTADSFDESVGQLWKGLFQVVGPPLAQATSAAFLAVARTALDESAHDSSRTQSTVVVAEYLGGLMRGIKHWKWADGLAAWNNVLLPAFNVILKQNLAEARFELCEGLSMGICDRDLRRYHPLSSLVLHSFEDSVGLSIAPSSTFQVRQIELLHAVLNESSWRDPAIILRATDVCLRSLVHPHLPIRQHVGIILAHFVKCLWVRDADSADDPSKLRLVLHLDLLRDEMCSKLMTKFEEGVRFGREQIQNLLERKRFYERFASTLVVFLTALFTRLRPRHVLEDRTTTFLSLLSTLFVEVEDEALHRSLRRCFVAIASYTFPSSLAVEIFEFVRQFLLSRSGKNWRVRMAFLRFLAIFCYRHQFALRSRESLLFDLMVIVLRDPQVEVRDLALVSFASLLRAAKHAVVMSLYNRFKQQLTLAAARRKGQKSSAHTRRRRRGSSIPSPTPVPSVGSNVSSYVFALCAIVKAYPHDLPSFVPGVLVLLSNYVGMRGTAKVVKATFTQFWEMHKDSWRIHKKRFDSDQLEIVEGLMVNPPSYFA